MTSLQGTRELCRPSFRGCIVSKRKPRSLHRLTFKALYHFFESFGLPRTVLCQTTGKLVTEEKFWVTAMVTSRFTTTCHQPLGTKTVSPGHWRISSWT